MADLLPIHAIYNGTTVAAYFRTSDVYGETGGVGAKVGIKKVKDADITGSEEILPIKEAMRVGLISRIGIRYKTTAGVKKSAKLLCRNTFIGKVFGELPADQLDDVDYKVGTVSKGKIYTVHNLRRASYY
jgi:hypothetical protein